MAIKSYCARGGISEVLCITELVKPNEKVTVDVYLHQLNKLNDELLQNIPKIASNRRKVFLFHDITRP